MSKKNLNSFSRDFFLQKGFIEDANGNFTPPATKSVIKLGGNQELLVSATSHHQTLTINNNTQVTLLGKTLLMAFDVDPIGKPRMTQQDKWRVDPNHTDPKIRQRKNVGLYWKYKAALVDQALITHFVMPEYDFHIVFHIPMPHSWSEKKKSLMRGNPHQQKPDVDNLCKGIFDSLLSDDSKIWDLRTTKFWADSGKILIYKI